MNRESPDNRPRAKQPGRLQSPAAGRRRRPWLWRADVAVALVVLVTVSAIALLPPRLFSGWQVEPLDSHWSDRFDEAMSLPIRDGASIDSASGTLAGGVIGLRVSAPNPLPSSFEVAWSWRIDEQPWEPLSFDGCVVSVPAPKQPFEEPTTAEAATRRFDTEVAADSRGRVWVDCSSTDGIDGWESFRATVALVEVDGAPALLPGLSVLHSDRRTDLNREIRIQAGVARVEIRLHQDSHALGNRWLFPIHPLPVESVESVGQWLGPTPTKRKWLTVGSRLYAEQHGALLATGDGPTIGVRVVVRAVEPGDEGSGGQRDV